MFYKKVFVPCRDLSIFVVGCSPVKNQVSLWLFFELQRIKTMHAKDKFEWNVYLGFILKETSGFQIYVNASLIGFIICLFTGHYSLVPFIVPLFVQVLARSNLKFRQRHLNALVALPTQAEDPVFIMDDKGDILLSVGKTQALFQKYSISDIENLLDPNALEGILKIAKTASRPHSRSIEAFSQATMKWYKIKAARMGQKDTSEQILVWFQDISLRKEHDLRLKELRRYSAALMHDLEKIVEKGTEFEYLASFLLKDYDAVFITRADEGSNLVGSAFKQTDTTVVQSAPIIIHRTSPAPINVSRKKAKIISDHLEDYDGTEAFLEKNPLDPRVLEFIGGHIHNFITYNEADLSIIAFNFKSRITDYQKRFFEILVNHYRTIITIVDLLKARNHT